MSDLLGTPLRLLLATDLTDRAVPAYDRAVQLAASNQAHLTVLHVIRDDLIKDVGEVVYGAAYEFMQKLEADARARGATDSHMMLVLAAHYDEAIIAEGKEYAAHMTVLGTEIPEPKKDYPPAPEIAM